MTEEAPKLAAATIEIEVPFADIDAQRIVWHGNYLRYFELARTELLRQCNLNSMLVDGRYQFVVSDSHCRHYRPLRFGDRCTILARFVDIEHRLNIRYLIKNAAGERVAIGHTHLVTLDSKGELQFMTPQEIRTRIEDLARTQAEESAPSRRSFLVATAAFLTLSVLPSSARAAEAIPPYVKRLLAAHKQAHFLEAQFVEEKHIAFLKAPLTSRGSLYFATPQMFARTTEKPSVSKLVVRNGQIAFKEGDGPVTRLSLGSRPELKALVEGILLLFAGDEAKIKSSFDLNESGDENSWTMDLVPKDPDMKKMVKKLVIMGTKEHLTAFQVHETSGDYSQTTLQGLHFDRKLSPEEKSKLFSV